MEARVRIPPGRGQLAFPALRGAPGTSPGFDAARNQNGADSMGREIRMGQEEEAGKDRSTSQQRARKESRRAPTCLWPQDRTRTKMATEDQSRCRKKKSTSRPKMGAPVAESELGNSYAPGLPLQTVSVGMTRMWARAEGLPGFAPGLNLLHRIRPLTLLAEGRHWYTAHEPSGVASAMSHGIVSGESGGCGRRRGRHVWGEVEEGQGRERGRKEEISPCDVICPSRPKGSGTRASQGERGWKRPRGGRVEDGERGGGSGRRRTRQRLQEQQATRCQRCRRRSPRPARACTARGPAPWSHEPAPHRAHP
jgi:hypothetical protein